MPSMVSADFAEGLSFSGKTCREVWQGDGVPLGRNCLLRLNFEPRNDWISNDMIRRGLVWVMM
jgi:hypothetical protein